MAQQQQQHELVEDVVMVVEAQRGDGGRHDGEGDGQVERQQVKSDGDGEQVDRALAASEWTNEASRRGELFRVACACKAEVWRRVVSWTF